MKKVMALLLAGSMTAALTACGGNSGAGGTTETTQAAAAATTEAAKEESKETSAAETAASGENYVFKFALQNGENHPLCQGVAKFGEILEEKSDAGKALLDKVQSSGTSVVCVGTYQESARNYFFTKKKVEHPSDMKNMQIRCQEGSVYYDAVEAMGAYAQSVAFSELYSALQSGVVDGAEQPLSGFVNNAFQEVAKYYVMDQHEISPNLILFSEATWNQLSQEDRDLIEESFQESVPYFEELSDSKDAEYLKTIEDAGTEIVQVDVSEWQDACSSVYDKYGEKYADIISEIKNTSY